MKKKSAKKINIKKNIKNEDLYNAIVESKRIDELTPEAVEMFIHMAHKASTKFKYRNPSDREDCISEALAEVLKRWRGFNEVEYKNAFAYYSTCLYNGMSKGYNELYPKNRVQTVSIDMESGVYNF